jgi:uncharacterized membrane protein YdbT with pleckstrin-like domain
LSSQPDAASEVLWEGHPWITPALAGLTIELVALAVALSWVEFATHIAFKAVGPVPLLLVTYGVVLLLWIGGSFRLALVRASSHYILRGSSLEIQHGILSRRIFTVSAAGFSDLQVIKSVWGRILNTGTLVIETDSDRDLRLRMIHDPVKVSIKIRQVMTVPVVRVSGQEPMPVKGNGK